MLDWNQLWTLVYFFVFVDTPFWIMKHRVTYFMTDCETHPHPYLNSSSWLNRGYHWIKEQRLLSSYYCDLLHVPRLPVRSMYSYSCTLAMVLGALFFLHVSFVAFDSWTSLVSKHSSQTVRFKPQTQEILSERPKLVLALCLIWNIVNAQVLFSLFGKLCHA